jgi:adenylosuccinate lyase
MALGKVGADRQVMHERLRQHSMKAWDAIQKGQPNPLVDDITRDPEILRYLPNDKPRLLMDASRHLGDAPQRARKLAEAIRRI